MPVGQTNQRLSSRSVKLFRPASVTGAARMSWKGPKSALGRFRAPILFLTGERENTNGATEESVAATPGAGILRVPGAGHLGCLYRSDLSAPLALPFLKQSLL